MYIFGGCTKAPNYDSHDSVIGTMLGTCQFFGRCAEASNYDSTMGTMPRTCLFFRAYEMLKSLTKALNPAEGHLLIAPPERHRLSQVGSLSQKYWTGIGYIFSLPNLVWFHKNSAKITLMVVTSHNGWHGVCSH